MSSRPLRRRALVGTARLLSKAGFEVTRDRFRHRFMHALRLHGVSEVLDVGANVGQFGAALRRAGYTGRIVSVEPLGSACAELRRNTADDPLWTVEQAAVSDSPGTLSINLSANSVSSSVLPILHRSTAAAPSSAYVGVEEVAATTVDDLVARHGLSPESALLKIDVQGYEMPVLEGAAETLERFVTIRTEMSLAELYDGQVLMPEMIGYLNQRGFDLWYVEPGFVEPGTRRLLQLDGLFVRAT